MTTNTELLNAGPARLLGGIERQRQFILKKLVCQMPCPNCGTRQSWFEAAGLAIDALDLEREPPTPIKTHCTLCKRELKKLLPAFIAGPEPGWYWFLVPIRVPVDSGAEIRPTPPAL